jgi:hypothetical protein
VKVAPLQIVAVMALTAGLGSTVTVTLKVAPVQVPETGVTVYTAFCTVLVGLIREPVTDPPLPATPPVMLPETTGADHVKIVPAGTIPLVPFTGVTVNVPELQIVAAISVIAGTGLTVTVTVKSGPVHDPDTGVTV